MATRARNNRKDIPGYDRGRPPREERQREHRRIRHAARQVLNQVDDPDAFEPLPESRRTTSTDGPQEDKAEVAPSRFKVWKTKFWKRRDKYRDMKAEMDLDWPVVIPDDERLRTNRMR